MSKRNNNGPVSPRRIAGLLALMLLASSCAWFDVAYLSSDALAGRNNGSDGSELAQQYLISVLDDFTVGANTGSATPYLQTYTGGGAPGTNVIAIMPGTDLADEYVMIGAHYDHLASCSTADPTDVICNGATDNAAGVAAALEIARALAEPDNAPRRSVVFAFWDSEEDGLVGSEQYVADPLVPLEDTVAYINFDILGSNLLPSLRTTSFAIAAETGGPPFEAAVDAAIGAEPLQTQRVSSIFGQFRSDYATLINAGVPSVFFSDSTGPCYHTTDDELGIVDFAKLQQQTAIALDLALQLTNGSVTPSLTAAPLAVYEDAVAINTVVQLGLADLDRFTPAQQQTFLTVGAQIEAIVNNGPSSFDTAAANSLLAGSVQLVSLLTAGECDGFLPPPGGEFTALTYNVAGLPAPLSGSDPEANTPIIGPLLNDYELVLLQESWQTPEPNGLDPLRVYHEILAAASTHSFQSVPAEQPLGTDPSRPTAQLADGLNRFTRFWSDPVERVAWTECNGVLDGASDCLAFKGFSKSVLGLGGGTEVDVYNLHVEAGGDAADEALKAQDLAELAAYINANSSGRAVIVGGDFNLRPSDPLDAPLYDTLFAATGLTSACDALGCDDADEIDRFLFRSSDAVTLTPVAWSPETDVFVDEAGQPLSDHPPIAVTFAWQASEAG
ncbi:MAG: M20/M25/M40 family metallo-hydrolase [Acidimicrobiales bacterium]|nr:M20/M25/M40 family metallo-hydrolase [Acidimicrobiales bacterium]